MAPFEFDALLERPEGVGTWTYLTVPTEVSTEFGAKGQVRVQGTVNGHPFRSTLLPHGDGRHYLVVGKPIRDAIDAHAGATVRVTLEPDTGPRELSVPDDLEAALSADERASLRFAALAYSHRKRYVDWIEEARRPETRTRRIAEALQRLRGDQGG